MEYAQTIHNAQARDPEYLQGAYSNPLGERYIFGKRALWEALRCGLRAYRKAL